MNRIANLLALFGLDCRKFLQSCRALPSYFVEYRKFKRALLTSRSSQSRMGKFYPCLSDRFEESGVISGHYFLQDLHVAQRVYTNSPERHVDVGSRVDGFVGHVASFRALEVVDIRPQSLKLSNISFIQLDLMKTIPPELKNYCDSLSCLHALEHFGLGRYGDPIDPDGHLRGLEHISEMIRPKGVLYLSVPIGPSRVEFNGQRVFSIVEMRDLIERNFEIVDFSFVDDSGELKESVGLGESALSMNAGCHYGCGIFEAIKS